MMNTSIKTNPATAPRNRSLQNDIEVLQERITAILLGENKTADEYFSSIASLTWPHKLTTTATTEIRYVSEGISWGVITPAVLIGMFLVILASCLYWQSRKEKRRMRNFMAQQRPPEVPFERSSEGRLSLRSTESQRSRGSSTCERIATVPLRRQGSRYYYRSEEEARRFTPIPRPLSPIDEMVHHKSVDTLLTSAGRGIDDSLKVMSSNLQESWGTPKTSGTESRLAVLRGYENPCFSAPGKLSGNVYCDECNAMNSPYYPNNNTPTNEYEVESDKSVLIAKNVDDLVHNNSHPESYPMHVYHHSRHQMSSLNGEEISSITTYPEHSHPPYMLGDPAISSNSVSSSTHSTLSLPSSISRFHASRTINTPNYPFASTRNCSPMKLNFTMSSNIEVSDQFSDNTSMLPCVGSSSTSTGTQAVSGNDIPASIYNDDLRTQIQDRGSKSASAPETRRPSIELMPETKSYSVEVDLFRSFSVTADSSQGAQSRISSSISCSMTQEVPHNPTPVSAHKEYDTISSSDKGANVLDENHNVQWFDLGELPNRKVKFTVPVLDKKQYWV